MRDKIIEFLRLNFLAPDHAFDQITGALKESVGAVDGVAGGDPRLDALTEYRAALKEQEGAIADDMVGVLSETFSEAEVDFLLAYFKSAACERWSAAKLLLIQGIDHRANLLLAERPDLKDRIFIQPATEWLEVQPGTGNVMHPDEAKAMQAEEYVPTPADPAVKDAPSRPYSP